jgi:hypothetical protein
MAGEGMQLHERDFERDRSGDGATPSVSISRISAPVLVLPARMSLTGSPHFWALYAAQAHRQNTRAIQQSPLLGGLQGAMTGRPSGSTRGTTQTPLGAHAIPDVSARDMSRGFAAC